jgi:hypothetical protein
LNKKNKGVSASQSNLKSGSSPSAYSQEDLGEFVEDLDAAKKLVGVVEKMKKFDFNDT